MAFAAGVPPEESFVPTLCLEAAQLGSVQIAAHQNWIAATLALSDGPRAIPTNRAVAAYPESMLMVRRNWQASTISIVSRQAAKLAKA